MKDSELVSEGSLHSWHGPSAALLLQWHYVYDICVRAVCPQHHDNDEQQDKT